MLLMKNHAPPNIFNVILKILHLQIQLEIVFQYIHLDIANDKIDLIT